MGAFDRVTDRDEPAEMPAAGKCGDGGRGGAEFAALRETRMPGEAYADLRQADEAGWDRHLRFSAPRGELAEFKLEDAGLPEVSLEEADRYVKRHRDDRPWLQAADDASPEARRIIVAGDMTGAHGHIRHEGWVSEEASMRRAAFLEDPAQLDPGERRRGTDGLSQDGGLHRCGKYATRITDPDAYATAVKRGSEHPDARAALGGQLAPGEYPRAVELPIAGLLGADGHKFCTGWMLDPGDGSMAKARDSRLKWQDAMSRDQAPAGPAPTARPVRTFEGGTVTFIIDKNEDLGRYVIDTVTVQPPKDTRQPPGQHS